MQFIFLLPPQSFLDFRLGFFGLVEVFWWFLGLGFLGGRVVLVAGFFVFFCLWILGVFVSFVFGVCGCLD